MSLREKYKQAISIAQQANMQSAEIDEAGGKLHLKGTAQTVPEKNRIWDAIKAVPGWETEVEADIKVSEAGMAAWKTVQATSSQPAPETYTVKSGDTLSKIAREFLHDSNAYMEIFNANRDQLSDPDKIKPGQVLRIPRMVSR
jgi:nucleoid-associated protein YgaU